MPIRPASAATRASRSAGRARAPSSQEVTAAARPSSTGLTPRYPATRITARTGRPAGTASATAAGQASATSANSEPVPRRYDRSAFTCTPRNRAYAATTGRRASTSGSTRQPKATAPAAMAASGLMPFQRVNSTPTMPEPAPQAAPTRVSLIKMTLSSCTRSGPAPATMPRARRAATP